MYDASPKLDHRKRPIPRRCAAVLPLEVRDLGIIPIPVVLDSGAPGTLYLGSKPLDILRELNLLKELAGGEYPFLEKNAALRYGESRLEPVLACTVPFPHESETGGTLGNIHVCCNILGLEALWRFPDLLRLTTD